MRERLLDAAMDLLATGDRELVSVRDITAAAGVNVAAVTTAFGGRSALLDALLARILVPVNLERARRFDRLTTDASVEDVVRAFLDPLVALSDEPASAVQGVLSAVAADSTAGRRPLDRILEDPGVGRLIGELRGRGLVPAGEAAQRVRLAVGTILAFAALSSGSGLSDRAEREQLVAFVTAGLRAPASPPYDREAPRAKS
ncbi:TetR family transcriptional regulator [Amycolatopsis sp. SID8362]|uniref:TetR family transcriptional regulator n=1 Tax=Amycolatopsis sp. SID8362 TaxID=2690346 RepID=UPI00136B76DB|nr:TetR family transcriptional regulator [Amycolatopsis sp. SID8362]NBH03246.1 TetR family transcriptional regulator [Amycolatopsis sp. SID8362]NED39947.1 TetR family transcriptional regulator [Amycolatopsis sp. SID8362]